MHSCWVVWACRCLDNTNTAQIWLRKAGLDAEYILGPSAPGLGHLLLIFKTRRSWECRPRGNRDMSANTSSSWEKTIQTPDDRRPDLGKKGYLDICSLKTRYTWGGVKFYFITWIDQWWWPFTDLLIFAHLYWGDRIFLGKYILAVFLGLILHSFLHLISLGPNNFCAS